MFIQTAMGAFRLYLSVLYNHHFNKFAFKRILPSHILPGCQTFRVGFLSRKEHLCRAGRPLGSEILPVKANGFYQHRSLSLLLKSCVDVVVCY